MLARVIVAALAAAAVTALVPASTAGAQDFDCRTASVAAEKAICSYPKLGQLDERMAVIYGRVWSRYDDRRREVLRDLQRTFLANRNACRADVACIRTAYEEHIGVLKRRLWASSPARG